MIAVLRAEWTKTRTLASMRWLLVATVAVTVAASAVVAGATHVSAGAPGGNGLDLPKLSLTGIDIGQAAIVVFAVLTISEEYGTGMIYTTLSATPHRLVVLAAKAINVVGLTLVAGVIAILGCLLAGRLMLPAAGLGPANGYALISLNNTPTLRAAGGSVLYLGLIALLSLGVGSVIRDTGVSIGVVFGVLYLPPILALAFSGIVRERIEQIGPMSAGLAIEATTNYSTVPIGPWPGLLVATTWAAGSLIIGGLFLALRDA